MKIDMVMPQMGESIAEATISRWLKGLGDSVQKDEIILEISTDKVDSEIPAPDSGTIVELLFQEGDVVPVKEKIAVIDTEGGAAVAAPAATKAAEPQQPEPVAAAPQETSSQGTSTGGAVAEVVPAPAETTQDSPSAVNGHGRASGGSTPRFYSPVVRSLAEKHGVSFNELERIEGTGQGGRVTKQDFLNFLESRGTSVIETQTVKTVVAESVPLSSTETVAASKTAAPTPAEYKAPTPDMPGTGWDADGTKVVPMDKMRQLIAEHMVRSKHTSPHVYSVQEVDMTLIAKWRARYKEEFKKSEGFGLSFTPFFLEAAVRGLLKFPLINSSVDGNRVIMKRHINLGCAVALGNSGLIVPVIKHAEERNFVGMARALWDLAARARDKKLLPDEVMGGTFTVTNPGVFGTMIGTPIINQPQVAILCLGQIKKRPVVVDDAIAIRDICYLTLSYDHRIVDGALGGQYLAFVREYLENWDMDRPLY